MAATSSMTSPPKKRQKLPIIGYKINRSVDPVKENSEIHAMLLEQKELLQEQKIEIDKLLISAEWDSEMKEAKVVKNCGSSLKVFGHCKNRCIYLYPEETLYLVEMNKLQLLYNDVRISVQRAYSLLLNSLTNVTLDRYRIFKHFVTHGYKLFRHERIPANESKSTPTSFTNSGATTTANVHSERCKKLQIFSPVSTNESVDENIIAYDVYSPQHVVRKSCRPEPDYYLVVIRYDEKMNALFQLISSFSCSNLLFAHVSGNSISVFNMQGVQIPDLF